MLISEALLLLFTKDNGKRDDFIGNQEAVLRAGLLADLAYVGEVSFSEDKKPLILLASLEPQPSDDQYPHAISHTLNALRERIAKKDKVRVDQYISGQWFRGREAIAQSLDDKGVVDAEASSFLGIPRLSMEINDPSVEAEFRNKLALALQGNSVPAADELVVLHFLKEMGTSTLRRVLKDDVPNMKPREMKACIESLVDSFGNEASADLANAVKRAIFAANVVMYTPVFVAIASS